MQKILIMLAVVCGLSANAQTAAFRRSNTNLPFYSSPLSNHVFMVDRGGGAAPANLTFGSLTSLLATIFAPFGATGGATNGIQQNGGIGTNTTLKNLQLANISGGASIQANVYSTSTWNLGQLSYSNGMFQPSSGTSWTIGDSNSFIAGRFSVQNTNTAAFTNDDIQFGGRGEIVMPSAAWSGQDENTWGGRLIWDYLGGTRSYPQGSSSSPMAFLGAFNQWGGAPNNPAMIMTCSNLRFEEGWNASSPYGLKIDIGNEDYYGIVGINYTPLLNGGFTAFNTLGRGHPLEFNTVYTIGSGGYLFSTPGIQAQAGGPGYSYGPGGNQRTLGKLGFYSGTPIPNSVNASNVWNTYPGVLTATMDTNDWFFNYAVYANSLTATGNVTGLRTIASSSFAGSVTATNAIYIGDGSTNNLVSKGMDISSGLQPAFLVGAVNNSTLRTSGVDKVFNMSLAPLTTGNPSHTIFTATDNGGYPTVSFGGGLGSLAPCAELDFYAATGPITTTGAGNLMMTIVDGAVQIKTRFRLDGTVTAAGTTGTQTINKPSGTVNFPAAATTVTVNNNLVTTDSVILVTIMANDSTALLKNVVPSSGSFVIRLNAATTAETKVGFMVMNPN